MSIRYGWYGMGRVLTVTILMSGVALAQEKAAAARERIAERRAKVAGSEQVQNAKADFAALTPEQKQEMTKYMQTLKGEYKDEAKQAAARMQENVAYMNEIYNSMTPAQQQQVMGEVARIKAIPTEQKVETVKQVGTAVATEVQNMTPEEKEKAKKDAKTFVTQDPEEKAKLIKETAESLKK